MTTKEIEELEIDNPPATALALMEKFKSTAPGSQKHCLNVAVLCESVGKEVGVDKLESLKTAALFHDVGKMLNPCFFIENQDGVNIHETLANPEISYQLLTRHVSDSVMILHQHKFKNEIIDIIMEHHGNTTVRYFLNVALKAEGTVNTPEFVNKFRYKCPKPQSTESAILMICDIVEAEARSKFTGNAPSDVVAVDALIDTRIKELIEDGQLDILRIGVMKTIHRVLAGEIKAMYHSRIKYEVGDNKSGDPVCKEVCNAKTV